jgi:hypothetical protein
MPIPAVCAFLSEGGGGGGATCLGFLLVTITYLFYNKNPLARLDYFARSTGVVTFCSVMISPLTLYLTTSRKIVFHCALATYVHSQAVHGTVPETSGAKWHPMHGNSMLL